MNNAMNLMMSPAFQAFLNPFSMSGNGSVLNQLLQAQQMANLANMQMPFKSFPQAWPTGAMKVGFNTIVLLVSGD